MQRPIFHEPWWLDAVAPRSWAEVTVEVDGQARAVLPYSTRRIGPGIVVLGAPPLTPYLGPLTDPGDGKPATRLKRDRELQAALVEQLPRHDVYKTTLPLDHRNWPVLAEHGFVGTPRVTYVLDALDDVEQVWNGFGDSTRRAVRKAEKRLAVRTDPGVASLLPMAAATFERQALGLPYSPDVLERAAEAAIGRDRGRVLTAVDEDDMVHASMLVVWDDDRAYYLVGGADPTRRESAGLSLLMWEAIKMSAAHTRRFDFEGSMVPGVERFFRGFGGTQYTYLGAMRFSRRGRIGWAAYQLLEAIRGR
ncbi:MAG: GNAT family N-acetyltransferase [Acidimicrobiales bacterium]